MKFLTPYIQSKGSGTTFLEVSTRVIGLTPICLPPLKEQERIVNKIETCFNKIQSIESNLNSAEEILEKYRESLLQKAFKGLLVPQDSSDEPASILLEKIKAEKNKQLKEGKSKKAKELDPISEEEKPYEIPESWVWVRLGEIGKTNIGLTYKPEDVVDSKSGIAVLRSGNIKNYKLDLSDTLYVKSEIIKNNTLVNQNDILICARNGSRKLVGKCAIIPNNLCTTSFGAFMAIYRTQYFKWVFYFLRSSLYRHRLDNIVTATINQITQNNLKSTKIPLPPLKEQERIVNKLEKHMTTINNLKEKIEAQREILKKSRESILNKAFKGKLVPQILEEGTGHKLLSEIIKLKESEK